MNKTKRKSIAPTLRIMSVGATESFPIEQSGSINTTIYGRGMAIERSKGMKWSVNVDTTTAIVNVTRVQ